MKHFSTLRSLVVIFTAALLLPVLASAQATSAKDYYFTAKTGTFTALSGGTEDTWIEDDDRTSTSAVSLGFTFTYCGVDYTQAYMSSNGYVTFKNTTGTWPGSLSALSVIGPAVMPLWDDLSGGAGTFSYKTTGTAPNRVFTAEYLNWLWDYSVSDPVISFQVKLFEGTNIIQFIYQQEAGEPAWFGTPAATIGLSGGTTTDYLSLSDASSAPTASSTTLNTDIEDKPATGQIYQFSPFPECGGTPIVNKPNGPATKVCSGADFTLSENISITYISKTYQWQSRPASTGTFTNIPGATSKTLTTNITANTDYQLIVTCAASGLSSTTPIRTVEVLNPLPVTASGVTTFCNNQPFSLLSPSDASLTYQWLEATTGDVAGATSETYTPIVSGRYTLRVMTPDCAAGATSKDTIDVTVKSAPTALVNPATTVTFCVGTTTTLTGSGTGDYQWVNSAGPLAGKTGTTYTTNVPDNYYLVITNPANGCADTSDIVKVLVSPAPIINANPPGTTRICTGTDITLNGVVVTGVGLSYQWFNNGGPVPGATGDVLNVNDSNDYTIVAYAGSCTDTSNVIQIRLRPLPDADISSVGGTKVVCPMNSDMKLEANAGSGYTYSWIYEGAAIAGATSIDYSVPKAGNYQVRVTDPYTCVQLSDTFVVINTPGALPTIAPKDITFCEGSEIKLYAGYDKYITTYEWLKNDTVLAGMTGSTLDINGSGAYTLIITDSFNCVTSSDASLAIMYPKPAKPVITKYGSLLSTTVAPTYQWYRNGKGLTGANARTYTIIFDGDYTVEVSDVHGCYNISDPIKVNGLGVADPALAASIKLHPNPAQDIVFIESAADVDLVVKDLQGKVIFSGKNVKEVRVANWASGVYFFSFAAEDGAIFKTEKMIKTDY